MDFANIRLALGGTVYYTRAEGLTHKVDGKVYLKPFQLTQPVVQLGAHEAAGAHAPVSSEILFRIAGKQIDQGGRWAGWITLQSDETLEDWARLAEADMENYGAG